jgi:hypothetical protein
VYRAIAFLPRNTPDDRPKRQSREAEEQRDHAPMPGELDDRQDEPDGRRPHQEVWKHFHATKPYPAPRAAKKDPAV